jgi:hypothetical protein
MGQLVKDMSENIDPTLTAMTLRHGNGTFVHIEVASYSDVVNLIPEVESLAGQERVVVLYLQLTTINPADEALQISEYLKKKLSKKASSYVALYYSHGITHRQFVKHFEKNINESLKDLQDKNNAWFAPAGIDKGLVYKP